MASIKRLVIPGDDQGPDRILKALGYADQICKAGGIEEIIFLVPTKDSLQSGSLNTYLGPNVHKALVKGDAVKLPSGALLRCETLRTLQWVSKQTVVIAVYASQSMMDKIDALNNVAAVVAVPWTSTSIDNWRKTWSPQVVGQTAPDTEALIGDAVVEQALKSLTAIVNRAHDVMHPTDVEHAKRILRILRYRNHNEPPENVRLWAIRNGWRPKAAQELEVIAEKAFGLQNKPKLDNAEHAEQLYLRWREAAN